MDGHRALSNLSALITTARDTPNSAAMAIAPKAVKYKVLTVYQEAVKDEALVEVTENELRAL